MTLLRPVFSLYKIRIKKIKKDIKEDGLKIISNYIVRKIFIIFHENNIHIRKKHQSKIKMYRSSQCLLIIFVTLINFSKYFLSKFCKRKINNKNLFNFKKQNKKICF